MASMVRYLGLLMLSDQEVDEVIINLIENLKINNKNFDILYDRPQFTLYTSDIVCCLPSLASMRFSYFKLQLFYD
jgi:hypothetical protein